jgi:hypothetical protein
MRRFLKYELDAYLSGRGGELIEELPLKLVEISRTCTTARAASPCTR